MFTTVYDAARSYDKEKELVRLLDDMCESEQQNWSGIVSAVESAPDALAFWATVWQEQIQRTRQILTTTS
jgi:hypothetical protein